MFLVEIVDNFAGGKISVWWFRFYLMMTDISEIGTCVGYKMMCREICKNWNGIPNYSLGSLKFQFKDAQFWSLMMTIEKWKMKIPWQRHGITL